MMIFPFPRPARTAPVRGTFAVSYAPNGVLRRPTSFVQRPAHPPHRFAIYPAPYSLAWGGDAEESATTATTYLPVITQAAGALFDTGDPRLMAATLTARIRNYERMRRIPPYNVVPGTVWYDNEIRRMRAKLAAVQQNLALAQEGESATRQWRGLGQVGLGVGIVAGIALTALLAAGAARVARGR